MISRAPAAIGRARAALAVALAIVALAAGCETAQQTRAERAARTTQSLNLSGFPPEYRRGFTDGCAAVGTDRRKAPAGSEAQFAQGWQDGLGYCTRRPPK